MNTEQTEGTTKQDKDSRAGLSKQTNVSTYLRRRRLTSCRNPRNHSLSQMHQFQKYAINPIPHQSRPGLHGETRDVGANRVETRSPHTAIRCFLSLGGEIFFDGVRDMSEISKRDGFELRGL
jgi:hypothetical protein